MRQHRVLVLFVLLTLGISWGGPALMLVAVRLGSGSAPSFQVYSPLYYLAVWSPALAALALVAWMLGPAGVRGFARRLLIWRVGARWYALVVIGIPVIYFFAAVLTSAAGEPALSFPSESWGAWVSAALLRATAEPVEELGWRGMALPLLQRRMSGGAAAIVLGIAWGVWHVPALVGGELYEGHFGQTLAVAVLLFFIETVALSVVITVVFNATRGSLLPAFLIHWLANLPYPWEGPVEPIAAQTVLLAAVAAILYVRCHARYLGRSGLATEVVAGSAWPV